MDFVWDNEKDALLRTTRGVSFEQIVQAVEDGLLIDVLENPNQQKYPGQRFMLVDFESYIYVVPFLWEPEQGRAVLKTVYPSRKYTKRYKGGEYADKKQ
jgi:uncharacterized DUF497 family protein